MDKELFRDFIKHADKHLINEPIDIYNYEELDDHIQKGWTFFFVKDETILANLDENGDLFYYTKNPSVLHNAIVIPEEEYSMRLLYIIVSSLNGTNQPYEERRSDFLNKIFYFMEIPIDGYVLSLYNIYPDIDATSIEKLK